MEEDAILHFLNVMVIFFMLYSFRCHLFVRTLFIKCQKAAVILCSKSRPFVVYKKGCKYETSPSCPVV